jgi:hypothetical protein
VDSITVISTERNAAVGADQLGLVTASETWDYVHPAARLH